MTSKRMTPEEVHGVGRAAAENALEIMSEAVALLNLGRPRRAFALGVIAVEEVAKHLHCRDQLKRWTGTLTVSQLKATLRPGGGQAHLSRYVATLQYLWLLSPGTPLPEGFDSLKAVAKEDMKARERVLYVDVHDSAKAMTPHGVSTEEARQWLGAMGKLFASLESAWQAGLDADLETARLRAKKLGGGA